MAISFEQYLQSLLQSITSYYTVAYSNDTELYNILQTYSSELVSGSIALETVRNNLFIVTCENSGLYNNFGTYFNQGKYSDQTYTEDRYKSGSSALRIVTPALDSLQTLEVFDSWTMASHSSPVTNFPGTWALSRMLEDTIVFDNKFVSSCRLVTDTDQPAQLYYDACIYDPVNNQWTPFITTPDESINTRTIGLNAHQPYIEKGQYSTQKYLYYLAFEFDKRVWKPDFDRAAKAYIVKVDPTNFDVLTGYPDLTYSEIIFYAGTNGPLKTFPDYSEFNYYTWTDSVIFHDNLYFGLCMTSLDAATTASLFPAHSIPVVAPDSDYRYPHLFKCDPITMDVAEIGFAAYISDIAGHTNYQLHAMAEHNNKLWIDVSSEDIEEVPFTLTNNNTAAGEAVLIYDFESSGTTIFAATGAGGGHARLLHSTNDGDTWNTKVDFGSLEVGTNYLYCCKEFAGSLYVGTDLNSIWRASSPYTLGSWTKVATFPGPALSFETFDGALFAATNPGGVSWAIYRTTDGINWTNVYSGTPDLTVQNGHFRFKEFNGYLYAAGTMEVVRSSDGTTWTESNDGFGTVGEDLIGASLEVHNNYLYTAMLSGNYLARTSNGTTWNIRYTGFTSVIGSILSYNNTLYVGLLNGELWSSIDDGETFTLFQVPGTLPRLRIHNGYAFCGVYYNTPKGLIYKWGGGPQHYMITYDDINFENAASPADEGDTILKMHSYNGQLYAIINNLVGGYTVCRYDNISWSIHKVFNYSINTMCEHEGSLIITLSNGDIFYLDLESDTWEQYLSISNLPPATRGITALTSYAMSPPKVYAFVDDVWYSSRFIYSDLIHYAVTGAEISSAMVQWASIPGYQKQLDFMLDAAMHGGTRQGIVSAANAFTLINPDIREAYAIPSWKLKSISGPITQLSSNVWQFSNSFSWRDNLWRGAYATFTDGSSVSDKIVAGYIILVNDNNTVNVGPIYDLRLLLDLTRIV